MLNMLTHLRFFSLLFIYVLLSSCENFTPDDFRTSTTISDLKISIGVNKEFTPIIKNDTFYFSLPYAINYNTVVPTFSIPEGAVAEPASLSNVNPQNFEFEIVVRKNVYSKKYKVIFSIGYPDIEFKPFLSNVEKKYFTIGDLNSKYLFKINNASDLKDDYKSVIIKVDKTSYNGKVYSYQGNAFIGFDEKFGFSNWNALFTSVNLQLIISSSYFNRSYTGQIITIEKKPYNEIYNWQDLQAINFKLDGHYVLKNDINIPKPNINGFPASGFKTIASDTNNTIDGFQGFSFTGSLDGNGFKINNLIIVNSDNDYVGMFGRVSNARFTNIRCNVDSIIGRLYVGGLCGSSQNSVFSKVEVTNGKIISSQNSVGGIIGNAVGGYIKNAFSNSEVYGSSRVGGLIGACEADSLADSYFTGSVFTTIREGGGIAGYNTSKVYKCYSTATQKTPSAVNYESFIGKNEGGTIRQSYWEKDPSGFSLSFFAIYVTNRTRISFLNNKFYDTGQNNLELFIGWDFNSTWLNKGNGSFPTLRWQ